MPIESEQGPGHVPFLTFDPAVNTSIGLENTIELVATRTVDGTSLNNATTVILLDETTGYPYAPTLVVHNGASSSRIEILPDRLHEYGHQISLKVTSGAKYTDGSPIGPLYQTWQIRSKPASRHFHAPEDFALLRDRAIAVTQPWARGWDDSAVTGQILRGMKNFSGGTVIGGADWLLSQTSSPYSGSPPDRATTTSIYQDWFGELTGAVSAAWGWHITNSDQYRDKIAEFVVPWVRSLDITPQYKSDSAGYPWDVIKWDILILKVCYILDLMWESGAFTAAEKAEIQMRLKVWGEIIADDWKKDYDANGLVNNIGAWTNAAVWAIGDVVGDHKIRAWAYDASDRPEDWAANARPYTFWEDNLFDASGIYADEATRENRQPGSGWSYGVYAAAALFWQQTMMAHSPYGVNRIYTNNVHGNTMEVAFDNYADYADGTSSWSDRYPGNSIPSYTLWWNCQKFFGRAARFFRSTKLRNCESLNFGTDQNGNVLREPFGGSHIHYGGGNLEGLPAATSVGGTDTTNPNPPTVGVVDDKGASWVALSWTASTVTEEDDVPERYDIYNASGPTLVGSSKEAKFVVTGLTPDVPYNFNVRAVDWSGNESTDLGIAVTTDSV